MATVSKVPYQPSQSLINLQRMYTKGQAPVLPQQDWNFTMMPPKTQV